MVNLDNQLIELIKKVEKKAPMNQWSIKKIVKAAKFVFKKHYRPNINGIFQTHIIDGMLESQLDDLIAKFKEVKDKKELVLLLDYDQKEMLMTLLQHLKI